MRHLHEGFSRMIACRDHNEMEKGTKLTRTHASVRTVVPAHAQAEPSKLRSPCYSVRERDGARADQRR